MGEQMKTDEYVATKMPHIIASEKERITCPPKTTRDKSARNTVVAVMIVLYAWFSFFFSEKRIAIRREYIEADTEASTKAVDSLLNYETVKYFGAEDRESQRYEEAVGAYSRAAVRNEVSLAWLNIGQSLITNLMMAGAMSSDMRTSIIGAVQAVASSNSLKRVRTAVYLIATSSQYQVER